MTHDIFAQAALLLIPCWPLLAACLLMLIPLPRIFGAARSLSLTGVALTVVLTPVAPDQDALSNGLRILASCVPWLALRDNQTLASSSRTALMVPFLATFSGIMALSAHAILPVTTWLGLTALLLAVREALTASRARIAWDHARLRVAGVVLSLLGATLGSLTTDAGSIRAGDLFLAIGLSLLAGLGPSPQKTSDSGTSAILDMLLRLGAIALILRLPDRDVTHLVFLCAGVATLWLAVPSRQSGPRTHAALATLCATLPESTLPALLFLANGMALASHRIPPTLRGWAASTLPPWPGFTAGLLLLGGLMSHHPVAAIVVGLALAIQAIHATFQVPSRLTWSAHVEAWLLLALGLAAPLFATHTWTFVWRPA